MIEFSQLYSSVQKALHAIARNQKSGVFPLQLCLARYYHTMNKIKDICNKFDQSHSILQFIFWWILTLALTSIVFPAISPLNPFYFRSDNSLFICIGSGWTEGYLPYRDMFDHKGPLQFAIYALGELIWSGKTGPFLLLSLFLSVTFYVIYKTARLYVTAASSLLVTLLYIASTAGIMGGYSEDFSLPFIVYPVYLMLRHLRQQKAAHSLPWHIWIITGICFAVMSLLRVNNAALVCGFVLSFGLLMLHEKRYLSVLQAAALFIVGSILVITPVAILLAGQGILTDTIYASYVYNFKYAAQGIQQKGLAEIARFTLDSLCVWCVLIAGYHLRKKLQKISGAEYFCLALASILAILSILPGNGYFHYFTLASPCVALALIMLAMLVEHYANCKVVLCAFAGWCLVAGYSTAFTAIIFRYGIFCSFLPELHRVPAAEIRLKADAETLTRIIPEEEKNQVIVYGGMGNVYLYTGSKPYNRYFFMQDIMTLKAQEIKDEMQALYEGQDVPRWIIFEKGDEERCRKNNFFLDHFLNSRCERIDYGGAYETLNLYKRKD